MAQQLQVFQDPSIVQNRPTTPLEQLQNRLDAIAPTYKMTPITPYPSTASAQQPQLWTPWQPSTMGSQVPYANGTQVASKDQTQLSASSAAPAWDASMGFVSMPGNVAANPAAAAADGIGIAPALAQTDPWAGARIAANEPVIPGLATGTPQAPGANVGSPVAAASDLHSLLSAYAASPAGSDPAVHDRLMQMQTPRSQLITDPNGTVFSTDKSGNMYKTALGNATGSTGFSAAEWIRNGYGSKQAWLDAGGKDAPNIAPPSTPSTKGKKHTGDNSIPSPTPTPLPVPAPGPTTPASPTGIEVFNRDVSFPTMPPYRPGFDNEWQYFKQKLAAGGVVGYADGGPVGTSDQADPRVMMIADAEDALQRDMSGAPQPGDKQTLEKFAQSFGPSALEQLKANVIEGLSMRAGMPGGGMPGMPAGGGLADASQGRLLQGPGTGTSDSIPAVVDGTQPAALSTGEFVMPAAAVAGAGRGDPAAGAKMLQDLSTRLSDMHKATKKKKAA